MMNLYFVPRDILKDLPLKKQVIEIAFILNAYHGMRLARKFGAFVSVELHTDTAHDLEAIIEYGRRMPRSIQTVHCKSTLYCHGLIGSQESS